MPLHGQHTGGGQALVMRFATQVHQAQPWRAGSSGADGHGQQVVTALPRIPQRFQCGGGAAQHRGHAGALRADDREIAR